jgi:hypothetical protein
LGIYILGRDNLLGRDKINFIGNFKNTEINNFTDNFKGGAINFCMLRGVWDKG